MNTDEHIEAFAAGVAEICIHTPLALDRSLRWVIIANPKAGGFTIPSRWKRHYTALGDSIEKARNNPRRIDAGPSPLAEEMDRGNRVLGTQGLLLTQGPGHAGKIVQVLMETISAVPPLQDVPFHLIITAGGDGTSLEVLNALYRVPGSLRSNLAVLRLPLGTGNDGADAWDLGKALELLIYPSRIEMIRALKLSTAAEGKGPFYGFNILSVGLDAFVTHMTNKMKGNLPGDSYKLWVDMAALFYDRIYHVGPIRVRAFDEAGNQVKSFQETLLLLAMGVSGYRTYGSHKWILPDERNVCAVKQMSLFRKLALKDLFTSGSHVNKPESLLFHAHRIEFHVEYPILAQMDGETLLLYPQDCPAVIELTEPAIPVLKRLSPGGSSPV